MKIKELLERKIFQVLTAYAALSWIILQIVDQLVDRSVLPELVYKLTLTLFISGLPGALIVAWFHGAKGAQKAPLLEKWLISIVIVMAFFACFFVYRANIDRKTENEVYNPPTYEDPKRIAVLYFEARGEEDDAELLSAGITESLIDELSRINELHVVSSNGSNLYRKSNLEIDSIGRALEAGILVHGNVAVSGDKIRLRFALVKTSDGSQIGSDRLERPRSELFDLQDELTIKVSDFIRREIGEEITNIQHRRDVNNVEAWELLYQATMMEGNAQQFIDNDDVPMASWELSRADSILALAEQADPGWLTPTVKRGWLAYKQSRFGGSDRSSYRFWIDKGIEYSDKALNLEPGNAEALEIKGTLLYWSYLLNLPENLESTLANAESLLNEAIKNNPYQSSALTTLCHLYLNKGWWSEAKNAALNAYKSDPFLKNTNVTLWRLFSISWDLGDSEEARRWAEEGLKRFPDDYRFHQAQFQLYALPGIEPDIPKAWKQYEKYLELLPPTNIELMKKFGLQMMGMVLVRAELPDSARAVALSGRGSIVEDPTRELAYLESMTRTWLGDLDEAVRLIGLYFSANPGASESFRIAWEDGDLGWLWGDLYGHPRFKALIGAN